MTDKPQDPGTKPPLQPDLGNATQPDRSPGEADVTGLEDIDQGSMADDLQQQPDEKPNAPNRDVNTAAAMPDPNADPWRGDDTGDPGRDHS